MTTTDPTTNAAIDPSLVAAFIANADLAELDAIHAMCNRRRKALHAAQADTALLTIKPGDRVRLQSVSPKYLVGTTATVLSHKRNKFQVRLEDGPMGRFGDVLNVPPTCLIKIEKEA